METLFLYKSVIEDRFDIHSFYVVASSAEDAEEEIKRKLGNELIQIISAPTLL